jgi:hypothetical protein
LRVQIDREIVDDFTGEGNEIQVPAELGDDGSTQTASVNAVPNDSFQSDLDGDMDVLQHLHRPDDKFVLQKTNKFCPLKVQPRNPDR